MEKRFTYLSMQRALEMLHTALSVILMVGAISSFGSLTACSQAAPRIQAATLRLVYHEGPEEAYERFSFFVLAEDDDGPLDLEELHLINDNAQLFWTLKSADWLKVQKNGQNWIGSHTIAMVDDKPFPRGAYRAMVVDKGGERADRTLAFDLPLSTIRPFPKLRLEGGRYSVTSTYPKNSLLVYDTAGAMIKSISLPRMEGLLADLSLGTGARALALWAEDEGSSVAALGESVPLR